MTVDPRPLAPRNVRALTTHLVDAIDVRWDDPRWLPENTDYGRFDLLGHRVYRSAESPDSGFRLVSGDVLFSRAFRDRTRIVDVRREDVTSRFTARGDNERREWRFVVRHTPVVVRRSQHRDTFDPTDVIVEVLLPQDDGAAPRLVRAMVAAVRGDTGEITLQSKPYLDLDTNRTLPPVLPDLTGQPTSGRVFCSYAYGDSLVSAALNRPYYYRVTTVARRTTDGLIVETPLTETQVANSLQLDGHDYIWNRANQLNAWLLEQAGERVLFFLRKRTGERCECYDSVHGRGRADCPTCFGTGYVGGFEGPFETQTTPFEGQKAVELTEMGLTMNVSYEISILDPFLLATGDLLVRPDGQRYMVNGVTPVGPRGTIRVQSASVSRLPESDFLYRLPVHPLQTRLSGPLEVDNGRMPGVGRPMLVDTRESDRTETKGLTIVFGNLQQGR